MNMDAFPKILVALIAVSIVAGGSASASGEAHSACKEDVRKLCSDVKPGGGRIIECLKAHSDKVSAECKAAIQEKKEEAKEANAACKEDIQKYCADIKPGGGRLKECLKSHRDSLSAPCKDKLREMHDKKQKGE